MWFYLFGKELISYKLVSIYTLNSQLSLKAPIKIVCKRFLTNSIDPDQTVPASSVIWGPNCLPLTFSNKQTFCCRFKVK